MNHATENRPLRALYLSHGGGPLPLLGDPAHTEMVKTLQQLAAGMARPEFIIVVSAHWEAPQATVTSGARPALIYDYHGFPEESYQIQYPCPGAPELAAEIVAQLQNADVAVSADAQRGFDHGLFVPLKIMYPEADIPCVQVSLLSHLDPQAHIELGQALRDLATPNTLVIGSGFSFHNMRAFFAPPSTEDRQANVAFDQWLQATLSDQGLSEAERQQKLVAWQQAPHARYCHPREEHLLPLHVCYGYAGKACDQLFELPILQKQASMYLWGERL